MRRTQTMIEHEIWIAAYLTALRTEEPSRAEFVADSAVKRYADRWGNKPGYAFHNAGNEPPLTCIPRFLFSEMNIPDQD